MSAVQQVVEALNVLYQNQDKSARDAANAWLSEFQNSNEAWSTAQLILFAPDAPLETKQFAAQTFKRKITRDLDSLPEAHRVPLRDSLLTAIRTFATGPRVILSEICIALADLSLQLTQLEWNDPTSAMIKSFGSEPGMAGALLEWLGAIVEEYNKNLRIQVKSEFGSKEKAAPQASQVIGLLSMYCQAPGITTTLQNQCFNCLGIWLRMGQAPVSTITGTPLLDSLFRSLSNPALFDSAVDCLVDIIHETQELDENMRVIEEIVPRLIALRPVLSLQSTKDDSDTFRGYCRIFVEAGEWYEPIIVRHQESFLPIVAAIAECSAYEDLDVVSITLNFWYRLSKRIRHSENGGSEALLNLFANLVETIIRQLHYPEQEITGQERDDFKSFRRSIGETLKDCCTVLGATTCLRRSYEIISSSLAAAVARGQEPKWQDIEAPLFSMRSMGAEVDPRENEIVPQIMDLLPQLPLHSKIRYAAILVVGRYTDWINFHPEYIQFQLPYVSAGFDSPDFEVSAAAAQTMKYLCKDCSHHLVPYLPQLHTFFKSVTNKLGPEDLLDLTAAIGHIIAVMPATEAPSALQLFCMPNIETIHSLSINPTPATKSELDSACDALARIDMLLATAGPLADGLPASCSGTVEQVWIILDAFLEKYGVLANVAEKTCICIRRGLSFFDEASFVVAPAVLERMAKNFELSAASSYLWITGKFVENFGRRREAKFEAVLKNVFERMSTKVFGLLQSTTPAQLADVLDDYVHLLNDLIEYSPHTIFLSPAFPPAFQALLSSLTLLAPAIVLSSLDVIRSIIGHECLIYSPSDPTSTISSDAHLYTTFAASIRSIVNMNGAALIGLLVDELISNSDDTATNVLTVFRIMAVSFSGVLSSELPVVVRRIPSKTISDLEKNEFLTMFANAINAENANRVKDAFTWLLRKSNKARERARINERLD